MKRLTIWVDNAYGGKTANLSGAACTLGRHGTMSPCNRKCQRDIFKSCDGCWYAMLLERLANYEDTGLEPERVAELAEADKGGRLVVLPTKDYTFRIRGDIALGVILANCRAAREEAEAALKQKEEGRKRNAEDQC